MATAASGTPSGAAGWRSFAWSGLILFGLGWAVFNIGGGILHWIAGTPWFGFLANTVLLAWACTAYAFVGWHLDRKRWAAQRIQVLADAGLPAPPMAELMKQRDEESRKIASAEQAWRTGCNTPALQGKRAGDDTKSILPLENVRTDANMAVWAEVSVAGGNGVTAAAIHENEETFRDLTPGCVDFEVRKMNGTGHRLQLIWHFKAKYEGVIRFADVPESPMDRLSFGVQPDGSPATIVASQSVSLYGLTRAGKSVTVRSFMFDAQRKGLPVSYRIADLKAEGLQLVEMNHSIGEWRGNYRVDGYTTTVEGAERQLTEMLEIMYARAEKMKAHKPFPLKQHIPTKEEPLLVFYADETLPLADIIRQGFKGNLGEIGYTGAALGVVAWTNVQLTDKAAGGDMRDLVPQALCFRVKTQAQMEAALGNGAAAGGAKCHLNPADGVGWRTSNSSYGWDEFRSAFVTDEEFFRFAEDGSLPADVGQEVGSKERWCATYVLPNVEDRILYVGKAFNPWGDLGKANGLPWGPGGRFEQHADKQPWWPEVDWSKVVVYWHRSEELALLRESQLIVKLAPLYNDQQNHNNPTRIDFRAVGYTPLEASLPEGVLAAEAAQRTRRGRLQARVAERRATRRAAPVEAPAVTIWPPVDELVQV